MQKKIRVSYDIAGKVLTKNYTTLNGCYKAIYNWLIANQGATSAVASCFIDGEYCSFTDANQLPISETPKTNFYQTQEWRKLRYQALTTLDLKCALCGITKEQGATMEVDHIKPKSKYPDLKLDINNLQILCSDCNKGKLDSD